MGVAWADVARGLGWRGIGNIDEMAHDLSIEDAVNETCPWSGKPIAADSLALYRGRVVGFCNPGCRDKFAQATARFDEALDARRDGREEEGA